MNSSKSETQKPLTATESTKPKRKRQDPQWKVRIYFRHCGVVHLLSRTEPVVHMTDGKIVDVTMDLVTNTLKGDTIGHIDWKEVTAVSWRPTAKIK